MKPAPTPNLEPLHATIDTVAHVLHLSSADISSAHSAVTLICAKGRMDKETLFSLTESVPGTLVALCDHMDLTPVELVQALAEPGRDWIKLLDEALTAKYLTA